MGGHLSGNFSWGHINALDNWDMGDSVSSSKREPSNWETSIWESSNQLRISLSITLGNHMSSIRETSITNMSSIWETSIPKSRSSNNSSAWWVVDKRGGGTDHPGGAGKDGRISVCITLGNHMSSIRETTITNMSSIWETSIPKSRSSNNSS